MRLGLVAGGGNLPDIIIKKFPDAAVARIITARGKEGAGRKFFISDLKGVISYFRGERVDTVAMTGDVYDAKPRISPDLIRLMLRVLFMRRRHDGILRLVIREFEKSGMRVVGVQELLPELLVPRGTPTKTKPSADDTAAIMRNWTDVRKFAASDKGQGAIIRNGRITATETSAGTDRLILSNRGDILIKLSKPNQDMRADIPIIGASTIENLAKTGYRGIAAEAGKTIFDDARATIRAANRHKIFIIGV
ncbi:MAG: UDP-2,3-diacylglucosamine diphosphatase LpxI [Rickettsiales bacterium]|jgi:DUF1009 family protein|nr:UDP-2,3-diacylglucosamine diphosphatase LpxI [Rickettsiales bacterium]